MINRQKLYEYTRGLEGWSAVPYKDSVGVWTIGWGFNIDEYGFPPQIAKRIAETGVVSISRVEGEDLLDIELENSIKKAYVLFKDFDSFTEDRQIVIVDMIFNMGFTRYSKFKRMIRAIQRKDWERAAVEAKDSLWYTQVGDRSKRNVKVLATGSGL